MAWITPITDRTSEDIANRTSKAFFNVADWTRITGNIPVVQDQILTLLGTSITLNSLTTPTITTFPSADDINSLAENIELLRQAGNLPAAIGLTPLKTDYETGPAGSSPDYVAVNAWENTLDTLRALLPRTASYFRRCGVGNCGQSHLWQARFRG